MQDKCLRLCKNVIQMESLEERRERTELISFSTDITRLQLKHISPSPQGPQTRHWCRVCINDGKIPVLYQWRSMQGVAGGGKVPSRLTKKIRREGKRGKSGKRKEVKFVKAAWDYPKGETFIMAGKGIQWYRPEGIRPVRKGVKMISKIEKEKNLLFHFY